MGGFKVRDRAFMEQRKEARGDLYRTQNPNPKPALLCVMLSLDHHHPKLQRGQQHRHPVGAQLQANGRCDRPTGRNLGGRPPSLPLERRRVAGWCLPVGDGWVRAPHPGPTFSLRRSRLPPDDFPLCTCTACLPELRATTPCWRRRKPVLRAVHLETQHIRTFAVSGADPHLQAPSGLALKADGHTLFLADRCVHNHRMKRNRLNSHPLSLRSSPPPIQARPSNFSAGRDVRRGRGGGLVPCGGTGWCGSSRAARRTREHGGAQYANGPGARGQ